MRVILRAHPPESKLRIEDSQPFSHSYLHKTSCWKWTTVASLVATQWSVWVGLLPEQLSPDSPLNSASSLHGSPVNHTQLCSYSSAQHTSNLRSLFLWLCLWTHSFKIQHLTWRQQVILLVANKQKAQILHKHLPIFRPVACYKSYPQLIWDRITCPSLKRNDSMKFYTPH